MSVSSKKGTLVAPVECIEERNPLSTLLFNRMVSRSSSFIRVNYCCSNSFRKIASRPTPTKPTPEGEKEVISTDWTLLTLCFANLYMPRGIDRLNPLQAHFPNPPNHSRKLKATEGSAWQIGSISLIQVLKRKGERSERESGAFMVSGIKVNKMNLSQIFDYEQLVRLYNRHTILN